MYLSNRFFYIFGGIVALFALGYGFPWLFPFVQAILLLAVALAIVDIVLLFSGKKQITAERKVEKVLSLSDPNPVSLIVQNAGNQSLYVEVVDELPIKLQKRDFQTFLRLDAGEQKVIEYQIQPMERGIFAFGRINVFLRSFLGLIERRIQLGEAEEVSVYPSIIQMKKYALRAFQQTSNEAGIKKMRRLGHSYEFEQIRNYVEGDDYRSINWKATSRRNQLMVNQYIDERSQQVFSIIDKGRTMRMPFEDLSLLDYAINTSLAMSNIIIKKGDKAGLFTFSDVLGSTLKADRSNNQMGKIMEALHREQYRSKESNFELLYQGIRRLISVRSLLLLYTNFESMYALERALPILRRINRFHLLCVVFFENTEIEELSEQAVRSTFDIYKQTVSKNFLQDKKEMVRKLRQYGIQAVLTRPQDLTVNTINKYLELKARGLI